MSVKSVNLHHVGNVGAHNKTAKSTKSEEIIIPIGKSTSQEVTQAKPKDVKAQITEDLNSGKLKYVERNSIVKLFGGEDYYLYHGGKKETFGDLKNRYNLPDGTIKKENGLRIGAGEVDKYGTNLNKFPINYYCDEGVRLPAEYINAKKK